MAGRDELPRRLRQRRPGSIRRRRPWREQQSIRERAREKKCKHGRLTSVNKGGLGRAPLLLREGSTTTLRLFFSSFRAPESQHWRHFRPPQDRLSARLQSKTTSLSLRTWILKSTDLICTLTCWSCCVTNDLIWELHGLVVTNHTNQGNMETSCIRRGNKSAVERVIELVSDGLL